MFVMTLFQQDDAVQSTVAKAMVLIFQALITNRKHQILQGLPFHYPIEHDRLLHEVINQKKEAGTRRSGYTQ